MLKAVLLRGPAESAPRLLGEAFKGAGIAHCQVGQDLAVQFDSALLQPVDELAIAHPVELGGGADAHDPQRTVLALLLAASSVGKLQPAFDRLRSEERRVGK